MATMGNACSDNSKTPIPGGRYQPESAATAKTHTTAGLMTSSSHGAASARNNAAAVCSELSNGKQVPANRSAVCKFSTTSDMSETSRDRLGQWPVESDGEVAGGVSGFARLHNGRFNKVSACGVVYNVTSVIYQGS